MKIVFSRKGFDSSAGGRPSPIVAGKPISLPIPTKRRSETTYDDLGLGPLVAKVTHDRIGGSHLCHDDPLFANGHCWFGQCSSAQGHLAKHEVGVGDVFLFFGLFQEVANGERHHRLFASMRVELCGSPDDIHKQVGWIAPPRPHPHFIGDWNRNNTIYFGPGVLARAANKELRLTIDGGPLNEWNVPSWLKEVGLTYHDKKERWLDGNRLDSAKRGQEFVCDIGERDDAHTWLNHILAEIEK